jgi:acetyl-CoA carboxylase carboxyl transferase subunit alpha
MFENTWYSVISPESCSSILWRSWDHKEKAAEALKLTADDMLGFGLIDEIIKEPVGGAHNDPEKMAKTLRLHIKNELTSLMKLSTEQRIENRLEKYSNMGEFTQLTEEEEFAISDNKPKKKAKK